MSEAFLGEIRIFSFEYAPRGWVKCDGQLLPVNRNEALYALLGTTYGGVKNQTFGVPDLRGRTPQAGTFNTFGQKLGTDTVTLETTQIPTHNHSVNGTTDNATGNSPSGTVFAKATTPLYQKYDANQSMTINENTLASIGGGAAHDNIQPSLVVNFCMCLQGMFPSRN